MSGRSQGSLAAAACVLAFGACTDPTENTDLRPSGPPEVLTVLASNDTKGMGIDEEATFCKPNDNKRPALVPADPNGPDQVCPDDLKMGADEVTDTTPVNWYVRLQFDELLNPDVEELMPIVQDGQDTGISSGSLANTQPVTLTCGGVNVPYDGYYDPSGNAYTWPLGPSLYIAPNDTSKVATGTECQVTIKPDVAADKDGNHVPTDQLGPYKFQIAALALTATNPAVPKDPTKPATVSPTKALVLTFNATIDATSLTAGEVLIRDATSCDPATATATVHTAVITADKNKQAIDVSDSAAAAMEAFLHAKTYIITFPAGGQVKDAAGGTGPLPEAADLTICFKTAV
jgi:hypothetical protein